MILPAEPSVTGVVPNAVSADGTTVVGAASFSALDGSPRRAFRWREGEGIVQLGTVLGGTRTSALAVSADGAVVAGEGNTSFDYAVGFRKVGDGGNQPVFDLNSANDRPTTSALAVSGDGTVVTGFHRNDDNHVRTFVWTANEGGGGTFSAMGQLLDGTARGTGAHWNRANAISTDGRYIAGWSDATGNSGNPPVQAFRYDRQTSMVTALGSLPGGQFNSDALGISADGAVVAGVSGSGDGNNQFFRWTESGGMTGTGLFSTPGQVVRMALSGDGRYIVSSTNGRAFRWSVEDGLEYLDELAPELAGWTLTVATGVSHDGRVIAGFGFPGEETGSGNEVPWILRLPAETPSGPMPPAPDLTLSLSGTGVDLAFAGRTDATGWTYRLEISEDLATWNTALRFTPAGDGVLPETSTDDASFSAAVVLIGDTFAASVEGPLPAARGFYRIAVGAP
ncbi:MAG: hypothetical protein JJU00_15580 [Opitutales bacterium]|nr:hypothetical protein [Opitutales bacterium]